MWKSVWFNTDIYVFHKSENGLEFADFSSSGFVCSCSGPLRTIHANGIMWKTSSFAGMTLLQISGFFFCQTWHHEEQTFSRLMLIFNVSYTLCALMFYEYPMLISTFLKMFIIISSLAAKNTTSSPTSVTVPFPIMFAFVCSDEVMLKVPSKTLIYQMSHQSKLLPHHLIKKHK